MKRALDRWVDGSIDAGQFSGTEDAIVSLKQARAEACRHARDFEPEGSPRIEQVINRVLKEGASGTEILDDVLGGQGVNFGGHGVRQTVEHLLRVLPGDETRGALREAVVNRLLDGTKASDRPGFGVIADRITDALENRGESLMGVLFTPNEIGHLRTLGNELRNVAKSGPTRQNAERGQSLLAQMGMFGVGGGSIGAGAGLLLGNPVAGAILGATATMAPVARNLLDRRAASAATGGGQGVPIGPALF
jgi:hypothetical protein